jgi:mitogen-activated protein kinase 15
LAFNIINSISLNSKKSFAQFFPSASDGFYFIKEALDLLKRCLTFNPKERISVDQALKHPFLAEFSEPEEVL